MKLVASAIVRNEAGRYLDTWLKHLLTFCDEVRLLDDGSTDGTPVIAARYPEVRIEVNRGPSFFEFESEARNALLAWTMRAEPTYVLAIDADEFIGDTVALREAALGGHRAYALTMREVWKLDHSHLGLRVDGQWGDRYCPILWAPPPVLRGRVWQIPRRQLACGREPQAIRSAHALRTDVGIYHFGWTREHERKQRAERYFKHDRGRFHADKHLRSILLPDDQVEIDWVPWPVSIPAALA